MINWTSLFDWKLSQLKSLAIVFHVFIFVKIIANKFLDTFRRWSWWTGGSQKMFVKISNEKYYHFHIIWKSQSLKSLTWLVKSFAHLFVNDRNQFLSCFSVCSMQDSNSSFGMFIIYVLFQLYTLTSLNHKTVNTKTMHSDEIMYRYLFYKKDHPCYITHDVWV